MALPHAADQQVCSLLAMHQADRSASAVAVAGCRRRRGPGRAGPQIRGRPLGPRWGAGASLLLPCAKIAAVRTSRYSHPLILSTPVTQAACGVPTADAYVSDAAAFHLALKPQSAAADEARRQMPELRQRLAEGRRLSPDGEAVLLLCYCALPGITASPASCQLLRAPPQLDSDCCCRPCESFNNKLLTIRCCLAELAQRITKVADQMPGSMLDGIGADMRAAAEALRLPSNNDVVRLLLVRLAAFALPHPLRPCCSTQALQFSWRNAEHRPQSEPPSWAASVP